MKIEVEGKVEPIILVLLFAVFACLGLVILVEKMFAQDGQIFQVFAGAATGFQGALIGQIVPKTIAALKQMSQQPIPAGGSSTSTIIAQETTKAPE